MTKPRMDDARLGRHLRETLHAVARTVTEQPETHPSRHLHRCGADTGGGGAGAIGAVAVSIPVAAGAVVGFGPEYVDHIPPAGMIVEGSLDGQRYWLVEPFHDELLRDSNAGCRVPRRGGQHHRT